MMAYILLNAFDLIIILRFYRRILKVCRLKKWVLFLASVLFLVFFSNLIEPEIPYINLVNLSCWSALFVLFFVYPARTKGFLIVIQIALAGVCQSLPYFLIRKYGLGSEFKVVLAGHFLFLCVMELAGRLYRVHRDSIKGRMWFLLLLIPAASLFSIPCVLVLGLNSDLPLKTLNGYLIPIFLFILGIDFVAFYLYDKLALLIETAEQNIRLEEQLEYQTAFYRSLEEAQESIRGIKHDMKNSLETVHSLLAQDKAEDAKAFINKITQSIQTAEQVVFTDNPPIDTILNIKINTAKKYRIPFQHQINIPAKLPIGYDQAAAILGNLLDNAIEAQQYLEEGERSIDFFMTYEKGALIIHIKNPFNRERVDLNTMATNKKDRKLHGIGLLNARKTVDAMEGILNITSEGNFIVADVLLYLQPA